MDLEARDKFFHSRDFMLLGQALDRENFRSVHMIVMRMQNDCRNCDLPDFTRSLNNLRQAANAKNVTACKDILAVMIAKRAQYLNNKPC